MAAHQPRLWTSCQRAFPSYRRRPPGSSTRASSLYHDYALGFMAGVLSSATCVLSMGWSSSLCALSQTFPSRSISMSIERPQEQGSAVRFRQVSICPEQRYTSLTIFRSNRLELFTFNDFVVAVRWKHDCFSNERTLPNRCQDVLLHSMRECTGDRTRARV